MVSVLFEITGLLGRGLGPSLGLWIHKPARHTQKLGHTSVSAFSGAPTRDLKAASFETSCDCFLIRLWDSQSSRALSTWKESKWPLSIAVRRPLFVAGTSQRRVRICGSEAPRFLRTKNSRG